MKRILSYTILENGKLPEGAKQNLSTVIPLFAGKRVRFTIEEAKYKRSNKANNYYWGVIIPHVRKVRAELGDPVSEELIHEHLLLEFSPRVEGKYLLKEMGLRPMRSKEMNVEQFNQYVTAITAAMAQFGYPVPMEGI